MRSLAANVQSERKGTADPHNSIEFGLLSSSPTEPVKQWTPADEQVRRPTGILWFAVAASVISATFLFSSNTTMTANIQPTIIEDFGEVAKLPWISVAFELGGLAVSLIWGKLHGRFNSKHLFNTAVIIFEVGNAVCGASPNMNSLIVGRALAGVGGSGAYVGTINIISSLTKSEERPLYMSIVGTIWCIGTVLGPIIGGAFAEKVTWRWGFYLNLCFAAVLAPCYIFLLPSQSKRGPGNMSLASRIRNIDFLGSLLFIGAMTSIIMGISFGGALYAWNSGQIIGLFICSAVLWIIFCVQQGLCLFTTPEDRIFPVEFLKDYEMWILFTQVASGISCAYIPIFFIPLLFQFVKGDSALESGVHLLPFIGPLVAALLINGGLITKGYYMPWFTVGGALVIIGSTLFHTIGLETSTSKIYGYSAIFAFGAGLYGQAPFAIAQAKVRPSQLSEISSFISCGQLGGIVMALAISNSVFVNLSTTKLSALLPNVPLGEVQSIIAGTGASLFDNLSLSEQQSVLGILVHNIDQVFIMLITAGALSTALSFFMRRERLFQRKDDVLVD